MRLAPSAYPPDTRGYKPRNVSKGIKDVVKQLREEARMKKVSTKRANYVVNPGGDVEMLPPLPDEHDEL